MSVSLRENSRLAKKNPDPATQPKNSTPILKTTVSMSRTLVRTRESISAKSYSNVRECLPAYHTEEY